MRKLISLLALLAAPLGAATVQLDGDDITYLGYFRLPNESVYNGGTNEITIAADCMGETDPTPSDGYAGCLIIADKFAGGEFYAGISDIVPPTMTGTNTSSTVNGRDSWDFLGNLYETVGCDSPERIGTPSEGPGCPTTGPEVAFYYDQSGCTLVWSAYSEYAQSPYDDDYIFGTSSCNYTTPNPQGMYRWDIDSDINDTTTDPFRATKWVYNIAKIPSAIATDYFGGDQMLLGPGKCTGSRGSSAGPSFGVRPWTFPTDSNGWDDFVPIFYYNSPSGYPRPYVATDFQSPAPYPACTGVETPHTCCTGAGTGCTGRDWGIVDMVMGAETVRIASGGDNYEAAVFAGSAAIVDPNVLSSSATPTESASDGLGGKVPSTDGTWGTYGSWDGTALPDLDEVPVAWYGIEQYNGTADTQQQPSFTDYIDVSGCTGVDTPAPGCTGVGTGSSNSRPPYDSNLVSFCSHGTGPSAQAMRMFIWLYDLAELGDMYAGTSGYGPEELMPYAEIDITFDPNNDGTLDENETCVQSGRQFGMAYDHTNDLLYLTVATDPATFPKPYDAGVRRGVMVFSFDPSGGGGGGSSQGGSGKDGAGADGGGIG